LFKSSTTFANDIALWKVFPPFILSGASVKSIPYAHFNMITNGTGIVAGWGDRSDSDPNGPRLLQKGDVNILTNIQCQSKHVQSNTSVNISDSHVCADTMSGGPCKGDHGGPLMTVRNGIKILIGIVSSTWNCTRSGPPRLCNWHIIHFVFVIGWNVITLTNGLYFSDTRTSSFYDWIQVQTTS